jgi:hypothetical protein
MSGIVLAAANFPKKARLGLEIIIVRSYDYVKPTVEVIKSYHLVCYRK